MQEHLSDPLSQAGLGTLASAVRRRLKHVVAGQIAPYGITLQQFWVILVLLEQGPMSLHPLAKQVWMDDPTASRVVKAMAERGLLQTQPDPRHGRRILISLPDESLPLAHELQTLATGIRGQVVAGMSLDHQTAMRQGFHLMIANLDAMLTPSLNGVSAGSK